MAKQTREEIIEELNGEIASIVRFVQENEALLRRKNELLEIEIREIENTLLLIEEWDTLLYKLRIREKIFPSNMQKKEWIDSHTTDEIKEIEGLDCNNVKKQIDELAKKTARFKNSKELAKKELSSKKLELAENIMNLNKSDSDMALKEKRDLFIQISNNDFNRRDFNKFGYHRNGTKYDNGGYDREGYDREGYDKKGFNQYCIHRNGTKYDNKGFNRNGYDQKGYDRHGYNQYGYNRYGYDRNGFNRKGYDREGFNRMGYNANGVNRKGKSIIGKRVKAFGLDAIVEKIDAKYVTVSFPGTVLPDRKLTI